MAGRHRGQTEPGPELGDASATSTYAFVLDDFQHESAEVGGGAGGRSTRGMLLIVAAVAIAVVTIGTLAMVLSAHGSGGGHRGAPQAAAQTTVEPTSERPLPEQLPTKGMYVPPRHTVTPVVRKSTPKRTPSHSAPAKPPCPFQVPFARDWCIAHGYAPPTG